MTLTALLAVLSAAGAALALIHWVHRRAYQEPDIVVRESRPQKTG